MRVRVTGNPNPNQLTLLQMEDSDQSEVTLWQSKATAEARAAGREETW